MGAIIVTGKINNKGFTLIEIFIVLALLAILASIAVPIYNESLLKARETVLKENLYQVRDAIDKHYGDKGVYPQNLPALVDSRYIRALPIDPMTNSTEGWEEVYADDGGGISDIKSGSSGVGRDGTPYNEW